MIFLLILSLAILFHELGHFVVARCLGVRVSRFCLFFDPGFCLFSTGNRFKTEFRIGWLPLGGYVKYDIPDGEPQPKWSLMAQSPWRRIAISLAGVAVNLVVAYGCLFSWARSYVCAEEVPTFYVAKRTVAVTVKRLNDVRHDMVELYTPDVVKETQDTRSEPSGVQGKVKGKSEDNYTNRFFPSAAVMRETSVSAQHFLWRFARINLILFLFNLLPIPPLDGAQTLFSTYELIFRRPINETLRIVLGIVGTLLLLGMMAFDMLSDILHFLHSLL